LRPGLFSGKSKDEFHILAHIAAHPQFLTGLENQPMMTMKPRMNFFYLTDVY
jgi:hypothetical protein